MKDISTDAHYCLQCGKPVMQTEGKKERKFCDDKCRMKWWNSHRAFIRHFYTHEEECQNCHKNFIVHGRKKHKYCCHACYIADRFKLKNKIKKFDIKYLIPKRRRRLYANNAKIHSKPSETKT